VIEGLPDRKKDQSRLVVASSPKATKHLGEDGIKHPLLGEARPMPPPERPPVTSCRFGGQLVGPMVRG
jgi:hypothetical protein